MRIEKSKIKLLYKQIPHRYRKRIYRVVLGMFFRALLNFAGIAALLATIMLALSDDKYIDYLWIIALCGIAFLAVKSAIVLAIDRDESRFLLSLYRYYSTTLLESYYRKGLLTIRKKGVAHLTHDVNAVCFSYVVRFLASIMRMCGELMLLLMIVVSLMFYSPMAMISVLIVFVPISFGYMYWVEARLERIGKDDNIIRRVHYQTIENTFRGYSEVEINQAYSTMSDRFSSELKGISKNQVYLDTLGKIPSILLEIAMAGLLLLLILLQNDITELKVILGVIGVAAFRIMPSIKSIMSGWNVIKNSNYTIDIISQIEELSEDDVEDEISISFESRLEVRDLSFKYGDDEVNIIDGQSFEIRVGEYVGIRGESGSGKSTLFNLLQGFFTPQKGGVYIDGVELTRNNRRSWHRLIGYVPQDVFIMSGTILENIAFGKNENEVDRDKVLRILQQVNLGDWVSSFEDGIDHTISGYGTTISGGQKQRIGIARALYKDARVLFFDEATSALDGKTESDIMRVIQQIKCIDSGLTMIMIAHRESSLAICDRVIDINE